MSRVSRYTWWVGARGPSRQDATRRAPSREVQRVGKRLKHSSWHLAARGWPESFGSLNHTKQRDQVSRWNQRHAAPAFYPIMRPSRCFLMLSASAGIPVGT